MRLVAYGIAGSALWCLITNMAFAGQSQKNSPKAFSHIRPTSQKLDQLKAMARKVGTKFVATSYPPGAAPGGTYTVRPGEERLYIADLYLPRGFTIEIDPTIKQIVWSVDNINAENGSTIDLSSSQDKPDKPPNIPPAHQKTYCEYGADGRQGTHGINGIVGTSLNMTVFGVINRGGILWIVSDGGPGGDGGDGQNGQQGGGPRRIMLHFCRAAHGGKRGQGGIPGNGGQPGEVAVTVNGKLLPSGIATKCGPSARPRANPSSILAISRGPGCPGEPGQAGLDGKSG